MGVTAKDVKELREATGAGMMDCKKALEECGGDFDKAANWLREKGIASAAKRQDREAKEGAVTSYIHMGGKIGVLVEVNCETDFVARGELFQQFCKDVCLQICSTSPRWVRREEASQADIDAEMAIYLVQAKESGKPEAVQQKISEGKLNKWLKENSLLEQEFVKNPDVTIEDLMKALSGKVGEKIDIRRFARFQLGEAIDGKKSSADEE
ncbi:MAG TPA: translation elongation factor Ts [Candidatus Hydrogenedentes bacterium]|jgi:elongation factor Ts|nr:translation elongation factor Ts [Candidatus Hydrogenedentota bacterium]MDY0030543.1 translation elongation factor Ts [FCB group bacterium]OQA28760.1 MAG: Elongation factor Ts [Verrucomicrobia bacterium ADurb.Bin345]NLT60952.1 translation elongation factor Ts [Candidatus Hydrogenedentota bacterium]HNZ16797.1 translation elongation factor Ts [Candidatus Hydrogenedentota bacterium]